MSVKSGKQSAPSATDVIRTLSGTVQEILGDELVSLIAFGPIVSGNFRRKTDTASLMLIVRNVSPETLDRIRPAVVTARRTLKLALMTLTQEELRTSCDVFPVRFHQIQNQHRLIAGTDVLAELEISSEHLRLRCEQELKNLMLRLRATWLEHAEDESRLEHVLLNSRQTIINNLRAVQYLRLGIVAEADKDVIRAEEKAGGCCLSVLADLVPERVSESPRKSFPILMTTVTELAEQVDRLCVSEHAVNRDQD